jgi:hypothetical protein
MSQQSAEADRVTDLKRIAMQVTTILPMDRDEALSVLGFARDLVDNFLYANQPAAEVGPDRSRADTVIAFPKSASAQ